MKRTLVNNEKEVNVTQHKKNEEDEPSGIFGIHPTLEYLNDQIDKIEEIHLLEKGRGKLVEIAKIARENGILVRYRPRSYFEKHLGSRNHQGVWIKVKDFEYTPWEELVGAEKKSFLLMPLGVQDPGNLGNLIRSARAFGCQGIFLSEREGCPVNSTVIKSSAGATSNLPIARVRKPKSILEECKKQGWWIYGLDIDGSSIRQSRLNNAPIVFVLGAEGKGLSESEKKSCDVLLKIDMEGGWDSLNVSSCGAIVLYEWDQQNKKQDP